MHKFLERIPNAILDELKVVLEREAERIVAQMKSLVPVDKGVLRDSIGWTWGDAPPGRIKIGVVGGKKFGELRISIYAGARNRNDKTLDAFYAYFQEFGTTQAPAQPFFFPVYRANRKAVKSNLRRGIKKALGKVKP